MKILVTGGTGLLGSRLIPPLIRAGHQVLALGRSDASRARLTELGAQALEADLDGERPLVLPSIDAVVHAAAMFRFSGPRAPFFRTNLRGTQRLLKAAEHAGASRFVYISAAGIVMDEAGSAMLDANESAPTYPEHFCAYLASKAQGEAAVLAANTQRFCTIALRPPAIWGPGDPFSHALPQAIRSGQFAFVERGDYGYATCHVDNVIEAVQCALRRGSGGRAYFISDAEKQTFRHFVGAIAGVQGLSIDKLRSMPYGLAALLGRGMDWLWSVRGKTDDPPISRAMMRMIGRPFTLDDSAARSELGYVGQTSLASGLSRYDEPAAAAR